MRYDLSGAGTSNGKPVPAGYIVFAPDKLKGNDGPGRTADIDNGQYRTRPKQGTIGGPHTATISGFDGKKVVVGPMINNPMGSPLFTNVQINVDVPKQAATRDFSLPAQK